MNSLSLVEALSATTYSGETPVDIVRVEASKLNGIDFVDETQRAAVIMRRLYGRKEATKAAQLWFADFVVLQGLWAGDDQRFATLADWLDEAFAGIEIFGAFKSTLNYWATVLAPSLRRFPVTDPVTCYQITPDYMIWSAGWGKIGDIIPTVRQITDEIETAWKMRPLSQDELKWLTGAENELRRRLEILAAWVVRPDMHRRDGELHQNLDSLLKQRRWRESKTPNKPLSLAAKDWASTGRLLIIGDLSRDEVNWLKKHRLWDVLSIEPRDLEEIIGENKDDGI